MKNFIIMGVHSKFQFLGGRLKKKTICGRGLPKKPFVDLTGGLAKKRGVVLEVDTQMHTI